VAARRNDIRLAEKLGVRQVPGVGTTVNFPYENADPVVFATTVESVDGHTTVYERDTPVFGIKAFTLVKKTKKVEITEELFEDTDVNLMAFLADHIGRAMGLTHNTALLVEAAASGTSVALGAAAAMTAGDPEKFAYHATLGYYLDDGGSAAWVMRPPTFGAIKNLTGTSRLYGEQAPGSVGRQLMEYPVYYSNAAAAIAASAKSVYFGNWYYMGLREGPSLSILRDPYSVDGLTLIKYSFRLCYGVLIAGGLAYGAHPSA
jgi:HK97 family phage major capsid protein